MANGRRRKRRGRFRAAVGARAQAMEVPLRESLQFCRAVAIAHRPEDDEMEALAFLAGEAFLRLETVEAELRDLFAVLEAR